MTSFQLVACPNEILELVLASCLTSTHDLNVKQIILLQRVHSKFVEPARRLLFRDVVIRTARSGAAFLECLKAVPALGDHVRRLTILPRAYQGGYEFSDLKADGIVSKCRQLRYLDNARANWAPLPDGRHPVSLYPSSLRSFRSSLTEDEIENGSWDSDSESEDDAGHSGSAPFLQRITELPRGVDAINFDLGGAHAQHATVHLEGEFPLVLRDAAFTSTVLPTAIVAWILKPAIKANCLRRLKLWGVSPATPHFVALVSLVAPLLEEFQYKPLVVDAGVALGQILPLFQRLKRLTLGPGATNKHSYSLIKPGLTHLCVHVPANLSFSDFTNYFRRGGRFDSVVRFEVYSQIYFPPILDIEYQPEYPSPSIALRELRLSHIGSKPSHIARFLSIVGSGLRTLALHHVEEATPILVGHCPSLSRLELGVNGHQIAANRMSSPQALAAVLPAKLSFMRCHMGSGIELADLIKTLKTKPRLSELDLTGIFPHNLASSWTGALIDELIDEAQKAYVHICLNGRRISTIGELWTAIVEHEQ